MHNVLLQKVERSRSWIGPTHCSDHFLIVLELDHNNPKLGAPIKFNPSWVVGEEFLSSVRENWRFLDPS